ncbi:MAG: Uma2 family endonuclease [Hormoscilla sp.]
MVKSANRTVSEHLSTAEERRSIFPLENGDRLTRAEFERRYQAMPQIKKAELIEGVVYMASPVRIASHGRPQAQIIAWLSGYWIATPGVDLADNTTVRLDMDNEPQPDVLLRLEERVGGQSWIDDDDYVVGAPELIAEIAASTAAIDLRDKLRVYRRNGVQEYLVWQVLDRRLDWFTLTQGEYVPLQADAEGVLRSKIFPGLWLAVPALLEGDLVRVVAVLQEGLASSEYGTFVQQFRQP